MNMQSMTTEDRIDQFDLRMKPIISIPFRDWLITNGFFTAPASMTHHGDYKGGLFDHSLCVTLKLQELTADNDLQWENEKSPLIVGFFHDLCKIDQYRLKNSCYPADSDWEWNKKADLNGHGEKSIALLSQFLCPSMEEIMCIRYHMGAFVDQKEWDYYGRACTTYPNVLWTHTADMLASRVAGI